MKFVILATVLLVVVAAMLIYGALQRQRQSQGTFDDYIHDPDLQDAAEEYYQQRESLTVPADISTAEIQTLIDRLYLPQDEDLNQRKLQLIGAKAVPLLIAELETERAFTTRFPEGGHALAAKSPFERICDLLRGTCPAAAAPLTRYASHEDEHFRQNAAIVLGTIGTPECSEPIKKLLADEEDYVRSFALMGIGRGIDAGRSEDAFLQAIYPALEPLLAHDDDSTDGNAPKIMLTINREQAAEAILAPERFTPQNKRLHYNIQALNEANYPIPQDQLLPLLKKLDPLCEKYPHSYEYAAAMEAYARNPDDDAAEYLQARLKSSNEVVCEGAAKALALLSGVDNPLEFVFNKIDEVGWEGLTPPQQDYLAVTLYDSEVNNGGHSQYYFNSAGENAASAVKGLQAIGAVERAKVAAESIAIFGPGGPAFDREERIAQLNRFTREQGERLSSLDARYYKSKENVSSLLLIYALQHKSDFSPAQ